jgi:GNAT superfamily N-acetyltransferase
VARNEDHEILGYAGGLFVHKNSKHGSSTSMLQYTYRQAIQALIQRPWLFFHTQMFQNYSLLWKNIKIKLGISRLSLKEQSAVQIPLVSSLGLVVIGTTLKARGKGAGSSLLRAIEEQARVLGAIKMHLSVRKSNDAAIAAYKRNGWSIEKQQGKNYNMIKKLQYS